MYCIFLTFLGFWCSKSKELLHVLGNLLSNLSLITCISNVVKQNCFSLDVPLRLQMPQYAGIVKAGFLLCQNSSPVLERASTLAGSQHIPNRCSSSDSRVLPQACMDWWADRLKYIFRVINEAFICEDSPSVPCASVSHKSELPLSCFWFSHLCFLTSLQRLL